MPRLAFGFVFGAGLPGLTAFEFALDSGPEPQRTPPPSRKRLVEEPLQWDKPPNRTEADVPVLKADSPSGKKLRFPRARRLVLDEPGTAFIPAPQAGPLSPPKELSPMRIVSEPQA